MTKLRIDTSTLQSCRSRRKSTPTDNSEECQLCHRGHEDVNHFLLMCPYFTLKRQQLLEQLKSHVPAFDNSPPEQKLSFILNVEHFDNRIGPPILNFIKCSYRKTLQVQTLAPAHPCRSSCQPPQRTSITKSVRALLILCLMLF